jgi:glucosamine--fructose-6-phosphate aminotransferase (isomerizing)
MCGIIGIVSNKKESIFEKGFSALRSLEYRGYDSFGFAGINNNIINTIRTTGAISETNIEKFNSISNLKTIIGHTRWATHGGVVEENSHPHLSSNKKVGIVHNGVISNFSKLASENPQWTLHSQTDTEIAANVISDALEQNNGNLSEALRDSLKILEGEFAICGILADKKDTMFAIKRKSPLVVGKLDGTFLLSSDYTAFSAFSLNINILHLEDESILIHTKDNTKLLTVNKGSLIEIEQVYTKESLINNQVDLDGYPHFMLKEINEASNAVKKIDYNLKKSKKSIVQEMLYSDISMTGSGSAYYVTMIGQYFFNSIGGKYIPTHPSDEYLNLKKLSRRDLILAVSQSGETYDTLEVLRNAKINNAAIVSINNNENSSMQRLADFPIYQESGKEVCVLSTKSIISQVSALYLLSVEMGLRTGELKIEEYNALLEDYKKVPDILNSIVSDYSNEIQKVAYQNCNIEHWFFIGRGAHYPVALESALKFKEVSYLHAEGMPAGFFKHGTISLIDENFYTVVFLPSSISDNDLYQATIDNVYEIKARGGNIIGIGHQIPQNIKDNLFFGYITLPDVNKHLNILSQLVAGQLLAYYAAVTLNRNIDKPRALAKSVTVR